MADSPLPAKECSEVEVAKKLVCQFSLVFNRRICRIPLPGQSMLCNLVTNRSTLLAGGALTAAEAAAAGRATTTSLNWSWAWWLTPRRAPGVSHVHLLGRRYEPKHVASKMGLAHGRAHKRVRRRAGGRADARSGGLRTL